MAVETLDDMVAGFLPPRAFYKAAFTGEVIGGLHTSFYLGGTPGPAVAPTPGLAGEALTSYPGQLYFPPAVGGKEIRLHRLEAIVSNNSIGMMELCDRLWHNSGLVNTSTAAQTVDSVAWPARDVNGSTNGEGVLLGLEYSTTSTQGSVGTVTVSYTNSAGTSGRTGTFSTPGSAVVGTFLPFTMQAGDTGVRSVQTVTFSVAPTAAVLHLVAYRPIASIITPVTAVGADRDGLSLGIPKMYDGSVPWWVYVLQSTTGGLTHGSITYVQA